MNFEFDSAKSTANLEKHGIDLISVRRARDEEAAAYFEA
jgi:uncharacterized DUF497 family protein